LKVTLTCTHFALADAALGIGDRTACEVCGTHRTIVHTGSGINITVQCSFVADVPGRMLPIVAINGAAA
jgi:hypothetical protein